MEQFDIFSLLKEWVVSLGGLGDLLIPSFVGVVAYLLGAISEKAKNIWSSRKTRRILNFVKNDVEIVLPIREGKISGLKNKTSPKTEFVTLNEVRIILEINGILELLKTPVKKVSVISDCSRVSPNKDLIYIGGVFANNGVFEIIKNKFPLFKIACSSDSFNKYENLRPVLVESLQGGYERWLEYNNNKILTFDNRYYSYIIMARLSGKSDYKDVSRGTTHVLFGSDAVATLAAVRCISENRDELFLRIKSKSERYFVALLCSKQGEIDFNSFHEIEG